MFDLLLNGAAVVLLLVIIIYDFFFAKRMRKEIDVLYNVVYRINSGKKVNMNITEDGDLSVSFDISDHK